MGKKVNHPVNVNINTGYICGLLASDGCFLIGVNGTNFSASISIVSTTNSNNLSHIRYWLSRKKNIVSRIYRSGNKLAAKSLKTGSQTAPVPFPSRTLRISGNKRVEIFLTMLKRESERLKNKSSFLFCGVKQRDYLLMLVFLETRKQQISLGRQAISLAIKLSLHKANYLQPDREFKNKKKRHELETQLGLTQMDPAIKLKNDAKIVDLFTDLDNCYCEQQSAIADGIRQNSLKVSPSYLAGVIDGDGSFYVTLNWKQYPNMKRSLLWGAYFTLSTTINNSLLFDVLKYVLELPPEFPVTDVKTLSTKYTTGAIGSRQIWIRNPKDVRRLLDCVQRHLVGDYRIQQLESVRKVLANKAGGLLTMSSANKQIMKDLLIEIYHVSAISNKGPSRKPPTIQKALTRLDAWFGPHISALPKVP